MNARKLTLTILIMIPVLLVLLAVYASINLNSLAKQGIETVGSNVTQSKVSLADSDISILTGEGSLNSLTVSNPAGFSENNIFSFAGIDIAIDRDSLLTDTLVIKNIDIRAPKILYEVSKSSSNLKKLLDNIESASSSADQNDDSSAFKKIIINRINISDGQISVLAPVIDKPLTASLPGITLNDIGRDTGGTDINAALALIMTELTNATAAASTLPLNTIRDKYGVKLDGETTGIVNTIKDKANEIGDKVKQLFQ